MRVCLWKLCSDCSALIFYTTLWIPSLNECAALNGIIPQASVLLFPPTAFQRFWSSPYVELISNLFKRDNSIKQRMSFFLLFSAGCIAIFSFYSRMKCTLDATVGNKVWLRIWFLQCWVCVCACLCVCVCYSCDSVINNFFGEVGTPWTCSWEGNRLA